MLLAFSLDKPSGLSSHQALYKIKKKFKLKKIGHTGTLDPFATGVLPVFVDEATKLIPYLDDSRKSYRAVLKLGSSTDTLDSTGLVIHEEKVPQLSLGEIEECLKWFVGYRKQMPPQYSAVKVKGKPLYRYAREGQEVQVEPRAIHIYSLKLLSYEDQKITFDCEVSRGTYVRVLGEEIAKSLGTLGHLSDLRRTQSGVFCLNHSLALHSLLELNSLEHLEKEFDVRKLITEIKTLHVDNETSANILMKGQAIKWDKGPLPEGEKVFIYHQDKLCCVAEIMMDPSQTKILKPVRVFNIE